MTRHPDRPEPAIVDELHVWPPGWAARLAQVAPMGFAPQDAPAFALLLEALDGLTIVSIAPDRHQAERLYQDAKRRIADGQLG